MGVGPGDRCWTWEWVLEMEIVAGNGNRAGGLHGHGHGGAGGGDAKKGCIKGSSRWPQLHGEDLITFLWGVRALNPLYDLWRRLGSSQPWIPPGGSVSSQPFVGSMGEAWELSVPCRIHGGGQGPLNLTGVINSSRSHELLHGGGLGAHNPLQESQTPQGICGALAHLNTLWDPRKIQPPAKREIVPEPGPTDEFMGPGGTCEDTRDVI